MIENVFPHILHIAIVGIDDIAILKMKLFPFSFQVQYFIIVCISV